VLTVVLVHQIPVKVPENLYTTLKDYQKTGLNWLNFLFEFKFSGILADDMGLGKTFFKGFDGDKHFGFWVFNFLRLIQNNITKMVFGKFINIFILIICHRLVGIASLLKRTSMHTIYCSQFLLLFGLKECESLVYIFANLRY
jgi:hypothetical protein